MNRRSFIGRLAGLAGAGAVAGTATASVSVRRTFYYRCSFCRHVEEYPVRAVPFELPELYCDCTGSTILMERFYSLEQMREQDARPAWWEIKDRRDMLAEMQRSGHLSPDAVKW